MFNWIKSLTKSSPTQNADKRQTRVVKRIVPASQRQAEAEEQAAIQEELETRANQATEARNAEREKSPPAITLTTNLPKAGQGAPISLKQPDVDTPRPVVSLHSDTPPSAEPVGDIPSPMVRLTTARKKPALSFGTVPAASTSREIVLSVGDFIDRIPGNFINEKSISHTQEVRFDASDLYSDMTKGRATVPLSIIADALPALFKRKISAEEDVEIQLPLSKIVAQMSDLFTRSDQEAPESFDEVETPFLKAAQRDQALHKVSGAVVTPAPAPAAAPVVKPAPVAKLAEPAPVVPVAEVIPVPVELPRPKPIGLRIAPPVMQEPEVEALPITPALAKKNPPKVGERRVTVRVRPLIQAMPIQQREILLGSIAEGTEVDLPLDAIESQLATGRVSLPLNTFSDALDPNFSKLFKDNFVGSEVPISLSEIVKNLPQNSLNMREDQHEQEVDPDEFETPFNTTPDTISTRPVAPSPLSAAIPPPEKKPIQAKPHVTPAIANYTTRKLNSTAGNFPSPMHAALGTQDALDAKKVVKLASALPGVASLTIIMEDGLSLAGNLPNFMDPEGFSAMAPQLHRKMAAHALDMKLGALKHLSLSTDTHTVTIFTGQGMTLAVLHQNQSDLGHGVKEKFIAIVDGLAKQYHNEEVAVH